ncbi:FCD domain-containing protein [Streptomyces sp. A475]|uniref:FadR/GntR family transcriptional regulator n=1 Tax=Streptomyces sp. A475 TaxID=3131976 RepID=UPI0030C9A6F1
MVSYAGRGVHGGVVESLGSRVVGGAVAVGATLDPRTLVDDMGVSLTVISEALKVLGSKSLVASRQKRGTFVRPCTEWNVLDADVICRCIEGCEVDAVLCDLAEMRSIVEPAAVRRAAERRTEQQLGDLEAAIDRMARAGDDAAEAVDADSDFHHALLVASGNEMPAMLHDLMALHCGRATASCTVTAAAQTTRCPVARAVLDATGT